MHCYCYLREELEFETDYSRSSVNSNPVTRAPLNRTLTLSAEELARYKNGLQTVTSALTVEQVRDRVFCQDIFTALPHLPSHFVDLLFADPPYNLTKTFNERRFRKTPIDVYAEWLDS